MRKKLKVEGMSCEHCKKRVENALLEIEGVSEVIVLLEDGTVEIDFNDAVLGEDAIIAAIDNAGYDVV